MTAKTTRLRPDHPISRVIKGCWQLAGDHGPVDRAAAIDDMERFLDAGITTFDCADIYTGVEEMIGEFIARLRKHRGSETADRVCVHTKLVPDLSRLADITADDVEAIIDRSLRRLRLEQLHLVQFFWWDLATGDPMRAVEALLRAQRKGKIRHVGVTNFDCEPIARFTDAGLDVVADQVQYSVLDRRPANTLVPWARAHDMQLLCYGTLAGGFITDTWLGEHDPGYEFDNRSLVKYRLIIDEFGPWSHFQALLSALRDVGDRHGVSLSTVAMRYVLDQPQVAGVIVGARYARYLENTLDVFSLRLDDGDRARIDALVAEAPGPRGPVFGLESDRTSRHGRIMKYDLNTRPDAEVFAKEAGG